MLLVGKAGRSGVCNRLFSIFFYSANFGPSRILSWGENLKYNLTRLWDIRVSTSGSRVLLKRCIPETEVANEYHSCISKNPNYGCQCNINGDRMWRSESSECMVWEFLKTMGQGIDESKLRYGGNGIQFINLGFSNYFHNGLIKFAHIYVHWLCQQFLWTDVVEITALRCRQVLSEMFSCTIIRVRFSEYLQMK